MARALLLLLSLSWLSAGLAWAQAAPGDLLVAEWGDGTVVNVRGGGDVSLAPRFATGLTTPAGLCVGPNGDVFVSEVSAGQVTIITAGGDFSAAAPFASGLTTPMGLHCTESLVLVAEFGIGELTDITAGGDFTGATPFASGPPEFVMAFEGPGGTLFASSNDEGNIYDVTAGGATGTPFASGAVATRGMGALGNTLLVADAPGGRVIDFSAGGDLSSAPTFATLNAPLALLEVPGLGLFATESEEVYEISAGGDFSSLPAGNWATGLTPLSGFAGGHAGLAYVPGCGDGLVQAPEDCDDGNSAPGDGCDAACLLEICGNGVVQAGETCDDGNSASGDGCDAGCMLEFCGDGTTQPSEDCDDGNTAAGDGCDASCVAEVCGNGAVQAGEECDDGNTVDGDGCGAGCLLEFCGDGAVQPGEGCDDGNTVDGDGCAADCSAASFCTASPDPLCIPAATASLHIDERKVGKEKLEVRLKKLEAPTTPADFGDPVAGITAFEVCVYDGAGVRVAGLQVDRAGDVCGAKGKPCWKAKQAGPQYKDGDAASAGVKKVATKAGDAGKGKLSVAAGNQSKKGQVSMPTGVTFLLQGEPGATVQVTTSDGLCFGADLTDVKKADVDRFKALR